MKMIFIFIDGFGIGEKNKSTNPVLAADTPGLDYIFQNFKVFPTDATLGIEGLPQSATGQTAIFTGINGSKALGRHLSGQPTETLIQIINNRNIFKTLKEKGLRFTYANVYRDPYLEEMKNPTTRKNRPSVTTIMGMSVDMAFRNVGDYRMGNGVYHDITGQILIESGYDVELITPQQAAKRLYNISRGYDFTLYEHFMTDVIGHKCDMEKSIRQIELIDEFLAQLLKLEDLREDLVVLASDHGNIEDVTVKTHTMNKVPTVFIGKVPQKIKIEIQSLLDIMPAVEKIMDSQRR